jgi:hypothetical protein
VSPHKQPGATVPQEIFPNNIRHPTVDFDPPAPGAPLGSTTQSASPSFTDLVQQQPNVEGQIHQLREQRLREHGVAVYIPLLAKASLQDRDETCFPLMENVDQFLSSDKMVYLLRGDSGSGKSTFNKQLEYQLWQRYTTTTGAIPLYINLSDIDKPEHDMIAKHLRILEFTERQIRELKQHRTFILIYDGYDDSQQTHNLYTSNRLNQPGGWNVKMVISCRSGCLGVSYRSRFQPEDHAQRSEVSLLQEAVIIPFSLVQIQEYINQYVSLHQPAWSASEYMKALEHSASLKDLVTNPLLLSLSLAVLPRMVDPDQDLTGTRITRAAFYDQLIEYWVEKGKKRLRQKDFGAQARTRYETLADEGFRQGAVSYLKRLSVAIYKEQNGQPIVSYSHYKDKDTWKSEFFGPDEEKQVLRELCPLVQHGHHYRFIHRSVLEYGVALAVFDPSDWEEEISSISRRGSASSFLILEDNEDVGPSGNSGLDPDSPLAWRTFVNEPSVLQFLEERVRQEPRFKQHLHDYVEQSKVDNKWRIAGANAMTILVRAGVQFNHTGLRGIQIPGAELSYGVFDSAQFQGADLRHVDFGGALFQGLDLSSARLTDAQFGEVPHLTQASEASVCAGMGSDADASISKEQLA